MEPPEDPWREKIEMVMVMWPIRQPELERLKESYIRLRVQYRKLCDAISTIEDCITREEPLRSLWSQKSDEQRAQGTKEEQERMASDFAASGKEKGMKDTRTTLEAKKRDRTRLQQSIDGLPRTMVQSKIDAIHRAAQHSTRYGNINGIDIALMNTYLASIDTALQQAEAEADERYEAVTEKHRKEKRKQEDKADAKKQKRIDEAAALGLTPDTYDKHIELIDGKIATMKPMHKPTPKYRSKIGDKGGKGGKGGKGSKGGKGGKGGKGDKSGKSGSAKNDEAHRPSKAGSNNPAVRRINKKVIARRWASEHKKGKELKSAIRKPQRPRKTTNGTSYISKKKNQVWQRRR